MPTCLTQNVSYDQKFLPPLAPTKGKWEGGDLNNEKSNGFGASVYQTTHTTISCSACQHLTVCMLSLLSLSNLEITPTIYNPFTFAPSSQYQMTVESVINMKHSHMFPALLVSCDDTSRSEGYA